MDDVALLIAIRCAIKLASGCESEADVAQGRCWFCTATALSFFFFFLPRESTGQVQAAGGESGDIHLGTTTL